MMMNYEAIYVGKIFSKLKPLPLKKFVSLEIIKNNISLLK